MRFQSTQLLLLLLYILIPLHYPLLLSHLQIIRTPFIKTAQFSRSCGHGDVHTKRATIRAAQMRGKMSENEHDFEGDNDIIDDEDMTSLDILEGSQLDEETEREILQTLEENMPSELQIRMKIMYVNYIPVYWY